MDQRIIDLFDEYTHKPLTREDFMKKLAMLTGSTAAALSVLSLLEVNYAHAQTTPLEDERITATYIEYPSGDITMKAYLVQPTKKKKCPGVVVIHENRGLNPHIEDVTRRVALEGFVALAPDGLAPLGGTPEDPDKAREMFQQLDSEKTIQNFADAFEYLKSLKQVSNHFGCVGFCWGGAMANNLAINVPSLDAAVSFYGRQPDLSKVPQIKGAVQLHYAEHDERINAGATAYEDALKAANVSFEIYRYAGAQHAFHNDTAPTRYNEEAAKKAWQRTIDFFKRSFS